MANNTKKNYWQGVEQLTNSTEFVKNSEKEFSEKLPIKDAYGDNSTDLSSNRRDFMKVMGFGVAAVSLAACEAPTRKAVPYLNKPEEIQPGVPNFYASTFVDGDDVVPVVVKTREGRPIFVEGNTFSSLTGGGSNARVQASVLSLYDNEKAQGPTKSGKGIGWGEADKAIAKQLADISAAGGAIRIVTNSVASPSTKNILNQFAEKFPGTDVVSYDVASASAIIEANGKQFGKAVVPGYDFSKADVIVSFGADFLETWLSSVEYSNQYFPGRKVGKDKKTMSQHFQFEAMLSLSGANADYRVTVQPSEEGLAVAALYNEVAKATGDATVNVGSVKVGKIKEAASALLKSKGKSLVVSASNDLSVQLLVNKINELLGNYGSTINLDSPYLIKQGVDSNMVAFVDELSKGKVDAVVFYNANPVYNHPLAKKIAAGIKKAKLSIATADRLDETAALCTYNLPDSNWLESWGDAETKPGYFSLVQPSISTIFNTRQVQQSLLVWMGEGVSYFDYLKDYWNANIYPLQSKESSFKKFWERSLHNGVVEVSSEGYKSVLATEEVEASEVSLSEISSDLKKNYKAGGTSAELVLYTPTILGNGKYANNPILQETPDPISKVTWGNFVSVSPALAKQLGVTTFETKTDVAEVKVGGTSFQLPVVVQPGLQRYTIAIGLGYGRSAENAGKVAAEAGGINAFALQVVGDNLSAAITKGVSITLTGEKTDVAQTQTHHTIMGRETIIQETTLAEYVKDDRAGAYDPHISSYSGAVKPGDVSIWDINGDGYEPFGKESSDHGHGHKHDGHGHDHKDGHQAITWKEEAGSKADEHAYPNHHWGMVIDLNTCTGCSACVVACHLENNVPVVGKQEVINRREMHWIRIDRYYTSTENASTLEELETAADNPEIVFQPMMCQHCNNAPCETVCPVAATTHSSEGLNQMTYNRCVGTKYCANNCPYKVRRFNWFKYNLNEEFDYHMNNDLGRMVLNPDVTVRSRGVMEKCSLCVQRIQSGKLKAKREGREIQDGDATTACSSVCPTNAITFGDLNNKSTEARTLLSHEIKSRAYNVLEEVGTKPNIWYLRKVRNKKA